MKAMRVKVKETVEDGTAQIWDGILTLGADNDNIFSLELASPAEIIKKSLSDEVIGEI